MSAQEDRTVFVRDNAEALLADRDAHIERQRARIVQLEQAVFGHKKERRRAEQRIADLEFQLRKSRARPQLSKWERCWRWLGA